LQMFTAGTVKYCVVTEILFSRLTN